MATISGDFGALSKILHLPLENTIPGQIGGHRHKFLKLLVRCFGAEEPTIALLWLADRDDETDNLALAQLCGQGIDAASLSADLRRTFVHSDLVATGHLPAALSRDEVSLRSGVSILSANHRLRSAIDRSLVDDRSVNELILPLTDLGKDGRHRVIGFVQLISRPTTPAGHQRSPGEPFLELTVGLLTRDIISSRERRILSALREMQDALVTTESVSQVYVVAAHVLTKYTGALRCVIREDRGITGIVPVADDKGVYNRPDEKVAVRPRSCTLWCFENRLPARIRNVQDSREVDRKTPGCTANLDQYVYLVGDTLSKDDNWPWMCIPILVENDPKRNMNGHCIALIQLYGKHDSPYLARSFSENDAEVALRVATYVAALVPKLALSTSLMELATLTTSYSSTLNDTFPALRRGLSLSIPSIRNAAIFDAEADEAEWIWPERPAPKLTPRPQAAPWAAQGPIVIGSGAFFPMRTTEAGWLIVHARQQPLPKYQQQIINGLAAELGYIKHGEERVRKNLHELIEIRHNLRSRLMGSRGPVETIVRIYKENVGVEPLAVYYNLFQRASFRKAISRIQYYMDSTAVLFEESKFILESLKGYNLQLGGVNLPSLVGRVIRAVEMWAERRQLNINFTNHIVGQDTIITGDSELLFILVFNLIDNAVKYSFRGRRISIELLIDRGVWQLEVTNDGAFIRLQDHERIFRPFVRAKTGSNETARPGTGLGLAVAKQIVLAHDPEGQIKVSSEALHHEQAPVARTKFTVRMRRKLSGRGR